MTTLGVNIDHIANVRQARKTVETDPVQFAFLAELGGADSITVHLREDRRHIQDRDVFLLKETINETQFRNGCYRRNVRNCKKNSSRLCNACT